MEELVLTKSITIIILQYINVWNQHIVYLKLIHCYMSIIYQLKKEKIICEKEELVQCLKEISEVNDVVTSYPTSGSHCI